MSKQEVKGSWFHHFKKNGIDYDIYADSSQGYFIFTEITSDESGYDEGILVFETRLGIGFSSSTNETKKQYLEKMVTDCDKVDGSCVILGGKLRKTKRKFRSRKNRRMKKTRRRRGKK